LFAQQNNDLAEATMSNKKEEQRRIKEEKQAAAAQRSRLQNVLMKVGLGILVPLVVVVLLYGLFSGQPTLPPDAISELDHVRGNPNAQVTVTVYADFQCPACKVEAELISRALPRIIQDTAKVVFRHYPLDTHQHAVLAARYAEAAARQDKFWAWHDMLFINQELWASVNDPTSLFDGFAKDLAMDMAKLQTDLADPALTEKIIADQRGGTRAGVRSTPTIFINGRLQPNPKTSTELVEWVEQAAKQSEAKQ
jgi:protein-disulfide isomerase